MNPHQHSACTHSIGAPSDMQDGSCSDLPIHYHRDEHGLWSVSFWKPLPEEVAQIMAGGGVMLMVRAVGRQHPVVGVGSYASEEPAPEINFKLVSEEENARLAAISTASFGYWKESDGILPDYDSIALRDVAKLYAKYEALRKVADTFCERVEKGEVRSVKTYNAFKVLLDPTFVKEG